MILLDDVTLTYPDGDARVTAVDPSARLVELAAARGTDGVTYRQLPAEHLDGVADGSVDAVCAMLDG